MLQDTQRNHETFEKKVYKKTKDPKLSYLRYIYSKQKCDANPNHRNIEWDLTLEEWTNIVQKNCFICGAEPTMKEGKVHKRIGTQVPINGVDRIDNSQGYIMSNVRSCCSKCNYMKHQLSDNEFRAHIKKIWSHNFANI